MEYRELMNGAVHASLLGYGCMRFPVDKESHKIDREKAQALIDRAMEAGITYYDTAWFYHDGESESFVGEALSKYPRDSFYLATKLPCSMADSVEKAKEIFEAQLERLQMDHVDFYLLHGLNARAWKKMQELEIPALLEQFRAQGKVRYIGFSFHDEYEVFEEILLAKAWDFCQIQLNYMDTEHQAGLKGLELARSRNVPVVVMEPVKGGSLALLPEETTVPLRALDPNASDASWAVRWVASQPGVEVILSGMSTAEQLEDNLAVMSPLRVLCEEENAAIEETARLLRLRVKNGCTGCRYCMPCPAGVDIPGNFSVWNSMAMYQNRARTKWSWSFQDEGERPHNCVGCGKCEEVCPQHIPIREHLALVSAEIEAFIKK